jgi:hypothetical protein
MSTCRIVVLCVMFSASELPSAKCTAGDRPFLNPFLCPPREVAYDSAGSQIIEGLANARAVLRDTIEALGLAKRFLRGRKRE